MFIIFIGAPGSGKGTQAKTLASALGVVHVPCGDLFRTAVEQGTELGRVAQEYMDRGELVPDEVTIGMIMERLSAPDTQRGVILDGFPRTVEQARALERAMDSHGGRVDLAVYLKVPNRVLMERLSGRLLCRRCQATYHQVFWPPHVADQCDFCGGELYQRRDDRAETSERRLEVYFGNTLPVVDFYRERGLLVEVNGDQYVENVRADLLTLIRQRAPRV